MRLTPVSFAIASISVASATADAIAFLRDCSLSILTVCCMPTCNANTSLISLLVKPILRRSSVTPLSAISLLSLAKFSAPLAAFPPSPPNFPELSLITCANSSRLKREPAAAALIPTMSLLKLAPVSLNFCQVLMPGLITPSSAVYASLEALTAAPPNVKAAFNGLKFFAAVSKAALIAPVPDDPPPPPPPPPAELPLMLASLVANLSNESSLRLTVSVAIKKILEI